MNSSLKKGAKKCLVFSFSIIISFDFWFGKYYAYITQTIEP